MATPTLYRCNDCDENVVPSLSSNSFRFNKLMCTTCGAELVPVVPPAVETPEIPIEENEGLRELMELFGSDMLETLRESMALSRPTRQISVSYLKTLGKIVVDETKSILRDVFISLGPMQILAVPATFGYIPVEESAELKSHLVCGSPECGDAAFTNSHECKDAIILLNRGVVSFATKSVRAHQTGAAAVVVSQTNGVWPFTMADSAGEVGAAVGKSEVPGLLPIPVVMVSKLDGELLRRWAAEGDGTRTHASSTAATAGTSSSTSTSARTSTNAGEEVGLQTGAAKGSASSSSSPRATAVLRFGHTVHECSICQEAFEVGNTVLKLPCRHVYHVDCVTAWLQQNNTCPLCRLQLPKEVPSSNSAGALHAAPATDNRSSDVYY
jgi:hypothetical protein